MSEHNIIDHINELVHKELPSLAPHLKEWAEQHLVTPYQVTISKDPGGLEEIKLWLVTDHTGHQDSSSRVVFDADVDEFGLEMTLSNGVAWFMGIYGGFTETVENM